MFNNFKSVINAATKTTTPQPAPTTSNFYASTPPVAPEPIAVDATHAAVPQKSVQGTVWDALPRFRLLFFLVCPLF
jgi:hypothetical protein